MLRRGRLPAGLRCAGRAQSPAPRGARAGRQRARAGLEVTVGTCLALTWLNAHVHLDTVLLLGSMASTYGAHRWHFAGGAALGSVLWFAVLGDGARLLRPVFARPAAWRYLDGALAVVMTVLAVSLALRGVGGG
ncbi:LysE family transporter [Blastococcus sp. HT6-30]|uniref:LysE/ArgO family amino acid transporter n=1 Tax=Blastococcus sp. HT6-30 TaxID=3144843 RepID=UPI00321C318B